MPRALFGVTVPMTAQAFLTDQLVALAERGWDVHLVTSPDDGFDRLGDLPGVTVHGLPMKRPPAPLQDARSLLAWMRLVKRLRPDVVVASTPKAGLLGMVSARQAKVPVRLYHVRGLRSEALSGLVATVSRVSERLAIACSTDVLCDSPTLRSALRRLGLLRLDQGVVLGAGSCCGVDAAHFVPAGPGERSSARASLGLDDSAFVLGFVGRLSVDKGIPELIRAMRDAHAADPRVRLVLVGPLEDAGELAREVEQLASSDWALVTGPIADPRDAYWAFDAFCLPSHREGFPIAPLEAQACGLPVVTTDATGCIDSIEPGVTGLAVAVGSPNQLAEAILSLAGDPGRARAMGRAGRERVLRDFGQDDVRRRFLDHLTGLVDRRRPQVR
ncbi:MAG: glycosyltransferase family 4 protein [Candidatus Nanopelagicales bacterium]